MTLDINRRADGPARAEPSAVTSVTPLPYRRADLPLEQRVADLVSRMTLEEKIDQLHQGNVGDTNPNNLAARADDFRPTYGSYIIGGPSVFEIRNAIQRRAVSESRLGIPVIFGADVIHGWRVITPIPLAQACTWNPALVQRGAAMAAEEASAQGVDWTFAPMVDHCMDARWGRMAETFGESSYASSVYGAASVRGYEGERLAQPGSIAACLKHFVGYGASEGGRDYSATDVSPQTLWDHHLPAFAAGVRAGARTVMSAFNDLNGVPTSANRFTLTEILRERWGFDGLVVSDWNAVLQLIRQGFAADETEAVRKAISAGVDLDMADGLYARHLRALVDSGEIPLPLVDQAVQRILRVKFELGLFEQPFTDRSPLTDATPHERQLQLAEELAAESIVLLKNDGVLPLSDSVRRIALIGPLGENRAALLGNWAQQGRPDETPTVAEALQERLPANVTLRCETGCSVEEHEPANFAPALSLARESDVVILCLGEEAQMSGENASRSSLRFAGQQEELALALAAIGKPVALVIISGRPLELHPLEARMNAVLAAWQGGSRAAAAIADVLFGRRNPSGKLAVTWPRTAGQIPVSPFLRPRARSGEEGAYRDIPTSPQYEFGHGLNYSTFEYGDLRLDRFAVGLTETLVAEVTVTNTSARDGAETVLWFISDRAASITRPLRELKHFEKAPIAAKTFHVFRFVIEPMRDLSFPDAEGQRILEAGEIQLYTGLRSARFNVTASPAESTALGATPRQRPEPAAHANDANPLG